jgi:tetratricopeptide (TPR) repeat protein
MHATIALDLAQRFGTPGDRLQAFKRKGELALRRGDLMEAERAYRDAMSIADSEARRAPGLESSTTVANVASRLGYVYKMASRQKECLETLGVALAATERLSAAEPAKTTHVRQIMKIHDDRGDALRSPFASAGMRPDLSLAEYEESKRRAEWLVNADPKDFSSRLALFLARAQVADTWREIDAKKALPLFRDLFPMAEVLKRDDPSNFQVGWITSLLWYAYADAIRKTGDLRAAQPVYDESVTRIARMRETDRGRKISSRDLMKVHAERGDLRLALGDVAGARADAEACLPFTSLFVTKDARPLDLRDSAYCFELAGDVAMRGGRRSEAAKHYDSALVQWREFGRRGLASDFLRDRLASAERRRAAAAQ